MENNEKNNNILPLVVIFVVIAGLIGGAYWFGKSSIMQNSPKEEISDVKDTEDVVAKEETQSEEISEAPAEGEEGTEEAAEEEAEDTNEITEGETDDEVIEILKILFAKKYERKIEDVTVTISKREGDYLTGGVKFAGEEAGGYVLAAKVNGAWKIIFDGNGSISCSPVDVVDFPSTLVSECWDESTMTSVDRTAK